MAGFNDSYSVLDNTGLSMHGGVSEIRQPVLQQGCAPSQQPLPPAPPAPGAPLSAPGPLVAFEGRSTSRKPPLSPRPSTGRGASTALPTRSAPLPRRWLWKLTANAPSHEWRKLFFVLLSDRLCYYADPNDRHRVKYLPLDQFPVRYLPASPLPAARTPGRARTPRGPSPLRPGRTPGSARRPPLGERNARPDAPIQMVDQAMFTGRQAGAGPAPDASGVLPTNAARSGCTFSVTCGSHTFFLAAEGPEEAREWTRALREAWERCALHAIRGGAAEGAAALPPGLPPPPVGAPALPSPAPRRAGAKYTVTVKTGSAQGAGTTARVALAMEGAGGSSGRVDLREARGGARPFLAGAEDVFDAEIAAELGDLERLEIWHDDTGRSPDWLLEWVRVRSERTGRSWFFPCHRWLSRSRGEHLMTTVELFPAVGDLPRVEYLVSLRTADRQGSDWQGEVSVRLEGTEGLGRDHALRPLAGGFARGMSTAHSTKEVASLGRLEWLNVTLPPHGHGWGLDRAEVTDLSTGDVYRFEWGKTVRGGTSQRIPVSRGGGGAKKTWALSLFTAPTQGAGTSSDVWVKMRGAGGAETSEIQLPVAAGQLASGQRADFTLNNVDDVGELQRLRLRTNGMGPRPDWLPEKVVLTDQAPGGRRYVFHCGQRMSRSDGTLERWLAEGEPDVSHGEYEVTFKTADERGAGTDGEVKMVLHSGAQASPELDFLDTSGRAFEAGNEDVFTKRGPRLGPLDAVTVELREVGSRRPWKLQWVRVRHVALGRTFFFPFGGWIGGQAGLTKRIPAGEEPRDTVPRASYELHVTTADDRYPPTTSAVTLAVHGEDGESGNLELLHCKDGGELFRRAGTNRFEHEGRRVGRMSRVVLSTDGMGAAPHWLPQQVRVVERDGESGAVIDDAWFVVRGAPLLGPERQQLEVPRSEGPYSPPGERYVVAVRTGDEPDAGTSSTVALVLEGDRARSGRLELARPTTPAPPFRPGQEDSFEFAAEALGDLQACVVGLEGGNLAWKLEWVRVTQASTGRQWLFAHGGWLGRGGPAQVRLTAGRPETYTLAIETEVGTTSGVLVDLFGAEGSTGEADVAHPEGFPSKSKRTVQVTAPRAVGQPSRLLVGLRPGGGNGQWRLSRVTVTAPSLPRAYVFVADSEQHCDGWFGPQARDGASRRVLAEGQPARSQATYRFEVQTSGKQGAGANNPVFAKLRGTRGETDWMELAQPGFKGFTSGSRAALEGLRGADVGTMTRLTVRMQAGHGNDDTWHLDHVRVTHGGTLGTDRHERWFYLRDWLSPEHGLERDMAARDGPMREEPREEGAIRVTTFTGRARGAACPRDAVVLGVTGTRGSSGPRPLLCPPGDEPFRPGAMGEGVVRARAADLGPPQFVDVELEAGPGGEPLSWQVEKLVLTYPDGAAYPFAPRAGDGFSLGLARSGPGGGVRLFPPGRHRYRVTVRTGPRGAAAPRALLCQVLQPDGAAVATAWHPAPEPLALSPARPCEFSFADDTCVAPMQELHLQLEGPFRWHLEDVTVHCLGTGETAVFPCGEVLEPGPGRPVLHKRLVLGGDRLAPAEAPAPPPPAAAPAAHPFHFTVLTGPEAPQAAGQDVSFVLFSDALAARNGTGATDWMQAHAGVEHASGPRPGAPLFAPGQTDKFALTAPGQFGPLRQLHLVMRSYEPIRWKLDEVQVSHYVGGQVLTQRFPCGAWLESQGARDGVHFAQVAVEAAAQTDAPAGPPRLGGYKVTFKTASRWLAGTGSQVHFELVGDCGASGLILPRMGPGSFKRGSVDAYEFPALRNLGQLRQLRLGHNGKGLFAGWAPLLVHVMERTAEGDAGERSWTFDCAGRWVCKENNNQIFVQAEEEAPGGGREDTAPTVRADGGAGGAGGEGAEGGAPADARGEARQRKEAAREAKRLEKEARKEAARQAKARGATPAKGWGRGAAAETPKKDLQGRLR